MAAVEFIKTIAYKGGNKKIKIVDGMVYRVYKHKHPCYLGDIWHYLNIERLGI